MLIGSALVNSEVGRSVAALGVDDVLGVMGLARRRSHLAESLALLGVGAAVGAGVALLLAPASGAETRKRLSEGLEKLSEQAVEKLEEVSDSSATASRSNHGARVAGA